MKIFVGLSGGADSTAAAWILKNEGYEVIGIHGIFTDESEDENLDLEKVKKLLDLEVVKVDLRDEFKRKVVNYFVEEYSKGRTPNPCAICNREIKFGILMDRVMGMGADKFATGHYVRLLRTDMGLTLAKGKDREKDQSYFLSLLRREKLERILFPLGDLTRKDVEKIVEKLGFRVDELRSSKDLCFVQKDYRSMVERYSLKLKTGFFLDEDGKILGKHDGIHGYTIGQRRGLGVSAGKPLYVKKIDKNGNIILTTKDRMYSNSFFVREPNWFVNVEYPVRCSCKIRYRSKEIRAIVENFDETRFKVILEEDAFAVTPGQISAFYDDDILLGGAIIEEVIENEKHTVG